MASPINPFLVSGAAGGSRRDDKEEKSSENAKTDNSSLEKIAANAKLQRALRKLKNLLWAFIKDRTDLTPDELRMCISCFEDESLFDRLDDEALKKQITKTSPTVLLFDARTLLRDKVRQRQKNQQKEELKAMNTLMKTDFEEFALTVWLEISEIRRQIMINPNLRALDKSGNIKRVPMLEEKIKKKEASIRKSTIDRDEGDEDDAMNGEEGEIGKQGKKMQSFLKDFIVTPENPEKSITKQAGKDFWSGHDEKYLEDYMGDDAKEKKSRRKQTLFLNVKDSSTKAAMDFETNFEIHTLRVRLRQVAELMAYMKSFLYTDPSKKDIWKRLIQLFQMLNSKFEKFTHKSKKLQDKELKKLEKVKKSDREFQKGDEVSLFWIEYDEHGDEEKRCDFTDFDESNDETLFWGYEQFKFMIAGKSKLMRRLLLRMDKKDWKSLKMSEKQRMRLIQKLDDEDPRFVIISVNLDDSHWTVERVVHEDEENEESEDGDWTGGKEITPTAHSDDSYDSESDDSDKEFADNLKKFYKPSKSKKPKP